MGYYSDVRFNTTKKGYEKFKALLSEDTKLCLFGYTDRPWVYDEYEDEVIFGWDTVKWYDEFSEVKDVMRAYREVSDDAPFEYVRIGEDRDDYEFNGADYAWYSPGNADLKRHIEPVLTINVY